MERLKLKQIFDRRDKEMRFIKTQRNIFMREKLPLLEQIKMLEFFEKVIDKKEKKFFGELSRREKKGEID